MHGDNGDTGILGSLHQLVETGKLAVSVDTSSTQTLGGTAHDHDQCLGIAKVSGGGKVVGGELHALLLHNGRDHLVVSALTTGGDQRRILGDGLGQAADLGVSGTVIAVIAVVGAIVGFVAAGSEAEHQHSREQQCENFLCHNSLSPFQILCGGRRHSRRPPHFVYWVAFDLLVSSRQQPYRPDAGPQYRTAYHPAGTQLPERRRRQRS